MNQQQKFYDYLLTSKVRLPFELEAKIAAKSLAMIDSPWRYDSRFLASNVSQQFQIDLDEAEALLLGLRSRWLKKRQCWHEKARYGQPWNHAEYEQYFWSAVQLHFEDPARTLLFEDGKLNFGWTKNGKKSRVATTSAANWTDASQFKDWDRRFAEKYGETLNP